MNWELSEGTDILLFLKDKEGWAQAKIKWDGCIELLYAYNVPAPFTGIHPQLLDSLHICDINELIKDLQELKRIAKNHFKLYGTDYEYWEEA